MFWCYEKTNKNKIRCVNRQFSEIKITAIDESHRQQYQSWILAVQYVN